MSFELIDESLHEMLSGTPDDMVTGQRVAITELTTFNPVGDGNKADTLGSEPVVDVIDAAVNIELRPLLRPDIVVLKLRKGMPVSQGPLRAVMDTVQTLYGGVDQCHATQGFDRQTAEILFGIALNDDYLQVMLKQFKRGSYSCQSTTYYGYVKSRFIRHYLFLPGRELIIMYQSYNT